MNSEHSCKGGWGARGREGNLKCWASPSALGMTWGGVAEKGRGSCTHWLELPVRPT